MPTQTTGRLPPAEWVAPGLRLQAPVLISRSRALHCQVKTSHGINLKALAPQLQGQLGASWRRSCDPQEGPCPSAPKTKAPWPGTDRAVSLTHHGGWPGCARVYHPAGGCNPSWDCSCLLHLPASLPAPTHSYLWENVMWQSLQGASSYVWAEECHRGPGQLCWLLVHSPMGLP